MITSATGEAWGIKKERPILTEVEAPASVAVAATDAADEATEAAPGT